LGRTVSRSCVANAASQILCDQLSFCFRLRHLDHESPYLVGEFHTSFPHQNVANRKPSPSHLLARLKKSGPARLDSADHSQPLRLPIRFHFNLKKGRVEWVEQQPPLPTLPNLSDAAG
jgi:hypothetical protein